MVGDLIEHSFIEGGGTETSSEEVYMDPRPKDIGPEKAKVVAPKEVQIPL